MKQKSSWYPEQSACLVGDVPRFACKHLTQQKIATSKRCILGFFETLYFYTRNHTVVDMMIGNLIRTFVLIYLSNREPNDWIPYGESFPYICICMYLSLVWRQIIGGIRTQTFLELSIRHYFCRLQPIQWDKTHTSQSNSKCIQSKEGPISFNSFLEHSNASPLPLYIQRKPS